MAKIISIAAHKAIKTQKRGAKFKLKSKQPPQAKRAKKRKNKREEQAMDTNKKFKKGFSIRDSFFKPRRDDLRYLRTHPHSLERTGGQK